MPIVFFMRRTAEAKASFLYLRNCFHCSLMAPGGIPGPIFPSLSSFLSNLPSVELLFQPLFGALELWLFFELLERMFRLWLFAIDNALVDDRSIFCESFASRKQSDRSINRSKIRNCSKAAKNNNGNKNCKSRWHRTNQRELIKLGGDRPERRLSRWLVRMPIQLTTVIAAKTRQKSHKLT